MGNFDFSNSSVKNADSLAMSLLALPQPLDDRGILWLRSLVKSKTTHKVVESLLLYFSEVGVSPQSPKQQDTRIDAVEASLLLNHAIDLVSVLSLNKTTPLKFELNAKLP